jgi:hypothetical protein
LAATNNKTVNQNITISLTNTTRFKTTRAGASILEHGVILPRLVQIPLDLVDEVLVTHELLEHGAGLARARGTVASGAAGKVDDLVGVEAAIDELLVRPAPRQVELGAAERARANNEAHRRRGVRDG